MAEQLKCEVCDGVLIWVGNALLPRGVVFLAIGATALAMICAFVYLTRNL